MRILVGQLAPQPGAVAANAEAVCAALDAHPDADLAAFPELFLSGYHAGRQESAALGLSDPALASIAAAAGRTRTAVLVGFAERTGDGLANSVACFDSGGATVAVYRKAQLFGPAEQEAFAPGEHLVLADLDGLRAGPMICFDVEFPEIARALSVAGAEVLVTVAANMAPYGPDHELAVRARALDNRRPHVYVNRVGSDGDLTFVGGSCVVGPDGSVIDRLGGEPELRCIDLDTTRWDDADVDYLPQIRSLDVALGEEAT